MKKGQIRLLGKIWTLSYTDGLKNFDKKFKSGNDLVSFANENEIQIMNKNTLMEKYKKHLKF